MFRVAGVAAALAAVSCAPAPTAFDGAEHDVTREYLRTVADGGSPAALYGACAGANGADAHRILAGEGTGFSFSLVASTRTDDTATVNVKVTGQDHSASPYNVDLRRENGKWRVCAMGPGHISIDVDAF
ncbi:hypothetical protein ACIBSV_09030 [Embleya sp. NPDC050154]|uniref:hypothetical protein n=1 Tax=unclassified Embleya TaxID=2699296 RepID=UPI0037880A11